jgi:hypothetical protein
MVRSAFRGDDLGWSAAVLTLEGDSVSLHLSGSDARGRHPWRTERVGRVAGDGRTRSQYAL